MYEKKYLYEKISKYAKKFRAIEYLGGKCERCGDTNWYHLEFHHFEKREFTVSSLLNKRWSRIKKELDKCKLYCGNCHQEFHSEERGDTEDSRRISKQIYLSYKGNVCEECGYDKCQSSLTFHHNDPNVKEIQFSDLNERVNNIEELKQNLLEELNKCSLLCFNCHKEKHIDFDFLNEYSNLIMDKMKSATKERREIDKEKVMKLYNSGWRQIDICKELDIPKGTLSGFIKKNKNMTR